MIDRTATANRVTWIGFFANFFLTLFKLAAGIFGRSGAMIADAVHSLSDFGTDIVVLTSFRYVGKPADRDHDYGHGKYETLATAIVGGALLLVGAELLRSGLFRVWGVMGGEKLDKPGFIALAAAVLSIVVKEWMFRYTRKVGKKINSPAVMANAWHHRSDSLSSIGAMMGIGGAIALGEKWRVLDPVAAVIVSLFIVKVAFGILAGSIRELAEASLGDEVKDEILRIAASMEAVEHPHNLRTRRIGSDIAMDLHIRVPADMKVVDAHAVATELEEKIYERFGESTFVSIHVEPYIDSDTGRL